MKYCTKCVNPDTRPGLTFNEDGVCAVCRYWEERKKIDWKAKRKELDEIIAWAKKRSTGYDCVLGVSGGKDSTRLAFFAKEELGLNVLLACCLPSEQTEIGRHNLNNLRSYGFDLVMIRPNPIVDRKLAKKSFYKYGNIGNPSEYALYSFPITTAIRYKIPLAFFGGNAALILGDHSRVIGENDADATKVSLKNTLAGGNASDWVGDGITEKDVLPYQIPGPGDIKKAGVKVIFLLHYIEDGTEYNNAQFAIGRGLKVREDNLEDLGRYRRYSALDNDLVVANQMLKHIKLGMGYATDEACWDIREGRLTRGEAIDLVKKYDGKCGEKYLQIFCDYIGISKNEFWRIANSFRGKMWKRDENGDWKLKKPI